MTATAVAKWRIRWQGKEGAVANSEEKGLVAGGGGNAAREDIYIRLSGDDCFPLSSFLTFGPKPVEMCKVGSAKNEIF
jgi:hypothetical protein